MKGSKAFSLIAHLPAKTRKAIGENLRNHKREQLFALYGLLEKASNKAEPESEEVYKKVFGKKYEKEKDYLLRNEYRLLYEELKELALLHASMPSAEQYLQYLLGINAYELFEEELGDAFKKAEAADNVQQLAALSDLKITFLLNHKTQALGTAQELAALSRRRIAWLQTLALREIRKEEVRLKLSERLLQVYKQDFTPYELLGHIDLNQQEALDAYAPYLRKRAYINAARGEEKIALLLDVLKLQDVQRKYEGKNSEASCRFYINLAQEYYLLGKYDEARTNYAEAANYIDEVPLVLSGALAYNYVLVLMRLQQFDKAKQVAEAYREHILSSKMHGGRGCFLFALLSIYAGNADEAEQYIQLETKKDGSEFYHFMRLALAMTYYLRGDVELALRECINLDQAINYELNREATLQTHITKPIIADFRKFYTIINSKLPAKEHKAAIKKLHKELTEVAATHGDQSPDSVLKQWLVREIEKMA